MRRAFGTWCAGWVSPCWAESDRELGRDRRRRFREQVVLAERRHNPRRGTSRSDSSARSRRAGHPRRRGALALARSGGPRRSRRLRPRPLCLFVDLAGRARSRRGGAARDRARLSGQRRLGPPLAVGLHRRGAQVGAPRLPRRSRHSASRSRRKLLRRRDRDARGSGQPGARRAARARRLGVPGVASSLDASNAPLPSRRRSRARASPAPNARLGTSPPALRSRRAGFRPSDRRSLASPSDPGNAAGGVALDPIRPAPVSRHGVEDPNAHSRHLGRFGPDPPSERGTATRLTDPRGEARGHTRRRSPAAARTARRLRAGGGRLPLRQRGRRPAARRRKALDRHLVLALASRPRLTRPSAPRCGGHGWRVNSRDNRCQRRGHRLAAGRRGRRSTPAPKRASHQNAQNQDEKSKTCLHDDPHFLLCRMEGGRKRSRRTFPAFVRLFYDPPPAAASGGPAGPQPASIRGLECRDRRSRVVFIDFREAFVGNADVTAPDTGLRIAPSRLASISERPER